MAVHDDALADRLALSLNREVVIVRAHGLVAVDRSRQFRQRMTHWNQRLGGRTLDRALVGGRQPRRMRRETLHWIDQFHDEFLPRIAVAAQNCFAILSLSRAAGSLYDITNSGKRDFRLSKPL